MNVFGLKDVVVAETACPLTDVMPSTSIVCTGVIHYSDLHGCIEREMQSCLGDYHTSVIFRIFKKRNRHLIQA